MKFQTPPTAQTLAAIDGSIAKWESIVAGTGKDLHAENCALCHMFAQNEECEGCPVKESTGYDDCRGSPYWDWIEAARGHYEITDENREFALPAAQAELDFLRKVRTAYAEYLEQHAQKAST